MQSDICLLQLKKFIKMLKVSSYLADKRRSRKTVLEVSVMFK